MSRLPSRLATISLPGQSDGCRWGGWAQAIMAQTDIRCHLTPCLAPMHWCTVCNATLATLSTDRYFQKTDSAVQRMLLVCLSTGSSNPSSPAVKCKDYLTFNPIPSSSPFPTFTLKSRMLKNSTAGQYSVNVIFASNYFFVDSGQCFFLQTG